MMKPEPGMAPWSHEDWVASGHRTLEAELQAISGLSERMDHNFASACTTLLACQGRVVVTGMGKSGHVARKLAATLASTGTPSLFLHPGEALHGDMGMVTSKDVVIALSNSGSTRELVMLMPLFKRLGVPVLSLTGNPDSILAQSADVHINTGVDREACPLGLAPTSSTTTTLVMGDALAIALLEARGFTKEDFAFSHPGGHLGRQLLLRVRDIMHTGQRLPVVHKSTALRQVLMEVTSKGMGLTAIVNDKGVLCGIFTDGDLRRTLDQGLDIAKTRVEEVMTGHCTTIAADALAAEALRLMEERRINGLICTDTEQKPVGALNMHDLLTSGVL